MHGWAVQNPAIVVTGSEYGKPGQGNHVDIRLEKQGYNSEE